MTAQPTRFAFDRHFDRPDGAPSADAAFADAARAVALADARAAGFEDGLRHAQASITGQSEAALKAISEQIAPVCAALAQVEAHIYAQAAELAVLSAKALAGAALAKFADCAVLEFVSSVLAEQLAQPRLVVRVPADLLDQLQPKIDELSVALGFHGKLILIGENASGPGDAAVEWALGGVTHSAADIGSQIDAEVRQFITNTANCRNRINDKQ